MKNQILINSVGNMSLHQQMSEAKRQGADSFVSTDGRMYFLHKGKWELQPEPKKDLKYYHELYQFAKLIGEDYAQSIKTIAALDGYTL